MRAGESAPKSISVLIVEDESLVADHQAALVERAGYAVLAAARDAEAALIAAEDNPPDVALIDVTLDGAIDGITVGRELRRRYGTSIIFVTGHLEQAVRQMPDLDATFIGKPFHDAELVRAVQDSLKTRGQ
jgi:DNA-binding response OmpR family regulator